MPVKDIHLYRLHAIEILPNHIERHKVPARIDHQSAPGEAWAVIDLQLCNRKTFRSTVDQLKESLQSVQHAARIRRNEEPPTCRHLHTSSITFSKPRHWTPRSGSTDHVPPP